MITREEAVWFLTQHLKNKNMIKHCLASEAAMRALARRFDADEDEWGLAGLLHDADVEISDSTTQGKKVGDMLEKRISGEMRQAMAAHNTETGTHPKTTFDYCLSAAETLTGLIVASTLVLSDKRIAGLTKESVMKRFNEKRFAAGADRELIRLCEKAGLPLDEFIDICLISMKEISHDLGL